MGTGKYTFDEFVEKYFTKDEHLAYRYTRNRDGYIFYADDIEAMMHYCNRTGEKP